MRHFSIPSPTYKQVSLVQGACALVAVLATVGASVEDLIVWALEGDHLVVHAHPVTSTIEGIGIEAEELVLTGGNDHIACVIVADNAPV